MYEMDVKIALQSIHSLNANTQMIKCDSTAFINCRHTSMPVSTIQCIPSTNNTIEAGQGAW